MSAASYKRNRAQGVTGRWTGTCFPAALDQLTRSHALPAETYSLYEDMVTKAMAYKGQEKRLRNPLYRYLFERIIEELGSSYDEAIFKRYKTRRGFTHGVARLLEDGCRVSIDILTEGCKATADGEVHTVGLKPLKPGEADGIILVSTWVPPELQGIITLEALYPHVAQTNEPSRQNFAFNDANVLALPA